MSSVSPAEGARGRPGARLKPPGASRPAKFLPYRNVKRLRKPLVKAISELEIGEVVRKKASATGKRASKQPGMDTSRQEGTQELKVTGLVAAGRKTQDGKAIYVKTKAALALTTIPTLLPYAFVCNCRCTPCCANILRARSASERDFAKEMRHHLEMNDNNIASLCSHACGKGDKAKEWQTELRTLLSA